MKKAYINLVKSTIVVLISILFFSACTDTEAELIKAEKALLQEYLTDNNISIVDIEGKTVWQQSSVSNEQINIPSILPKGAYYITLRNKDNQVFTKKLIK